MKHFKAIIIWIIIFIVGSLIVSFLIDPSSFESFEENVQKIIPDIKGLSTETVRLVPSEMEEYGWAREYHKSCAYLESLGESEGITDMKGKVCREACGKRNMSYSSKDCENNLFVCYCNKV